MSAVLELLAGSVAPREATRQQISNHFPPHVRDALVAASRVDTGFDHLARIEAIDEAAERARLLHPELFR